MSQPTQESPQEDIRAIETLLRTLEEAILQGDPNILAGLFCREVGAVFSGTPEPVRGREAVTATWKRHLTRWSEVKIRRRDTRVRIHGDVAWATFLWDGEGASAGKRYRLEGERWHQVQDIPQAMAPVGYLEGQGKNPSERLHEIGPASEGTVCEVVLAVGPAFGRELTETINGLPHDQVLEQILTGIAEEGLTARVVKIHHSADCAFIGYAGAQLSGSGVSVGIQSRGTTVIHRKDLAPLNNLELFSQSPNLTLESFRQIGRNAARYAKGEAVQPVPVKVDNWVRLRLIVKTMLLHRRECEQVDPKRSPTELRFDWEPDLESEVGGTASGPSVERME